MLMDLNSTPKPGESFPLALTFQKAGTQAVTATVDKPAGHGH
jgi:copper(I)-binding protein